MFSCLLNKSKGQHNVELKVTHSEQGHVQNAGNVPGFFILSNAGLPRLLVA